MQYRTLGGTGIKVSPYALGAMMLGATSNPPTCRRRSNIPSCGADRRPSDEFDSAGGHSGDMQIELPHDAAAFHVADTSVPGSSWLVRPANDLTVIVLTQRQFESPALPRVHMDIQAAAYTALR